jgi:hypothetical protein
MNHLILREEIFKISVEKEDWEKASKEWELINVKYTETGNCICTHPVKWDYWIRNKLNQVETHVGSECIDYFQNQSLNEDAKLRKTNLKREMRGKGMLKKCIECGKNTIKTDYDGEPLHKKCGDKRTWDRINENRRKEKEKNKPMFDNEIPKLLEIRFKIDDWGQKFLDDIISKCLDVGLTDKQAKVVNRMMKQYLPELVPPKKKATKKRATKKK